ncbi:hypothetical protein [Bacillus sp. P14.5]|uniref:hypothetical protein n=1 Tax=Bacillus sp. P14.5 TaxID=1983400 RepID=UPI000DE841A8|nr:hypothetical protein [Bacillus sp. P14.5]
MKYALLSAGTALSIIFGGGFLIRLLRDGDFFIAEFSGGVLGILLIVLTIFIDDNNQKESSKRGNA